MFNAKFITLKKFKKIKDSLPNVISFSCFMRYWTIEFTGDFEDLDKIDNCYFFASRMMDTGEMRVYYRFIPKWAYEHGYWGAKAAQEIGSHS